MEDKWKYIQLKVNDSLFFGTWWNPVIKKVLF